MQHAWQQCHCQAHPERALATRLQNHVAFVTGLQKEEGIIRVTI